MNIGIIGTGLLGYAVAKRLRDSRYEVVAYNRTSKKIEPLKKIGVRVVESPKEVAEKSDLVIIIVSDVSAVEAVSFESGGIIEGKHNKLTVANMSTINPISSKNIAAKFAKHGITMIESPVMGGPPLAEKGRLIPMIGGDKKSYNKWKKVFDSIGERTFYTGSNGSATTTKLAINLFIANLALSLSEGIMLSKKSGLDPALFLEVLNSTYFKTGMSLLKGPRMIKGIFTPSFFLKVMQKDLKEINLTAKEFDIKLPMAKLANQTYRNAVKEGFGEIDYTGILSYLQKINSSG